MWWTGQVCYKLNCTTDLSSATPSKVTWIQWPLWGEKVSLHEKLKEHLVLKLWWWTGQVCYKLNCTTDLSSATPSKVTWIQWPLWGEKVSLHEKLKEHLVHKLWWWTRQVCYKLNCMTDLSSATPSKVTWIQWPLWGEKVSLHEKLKEHLVLKLWWWSGQVCYILNCTTDLSSATPSKVTWIQWPLWGEKVSLHEKLKEHLVLKLWWWTGQVCYKLNYTPVKCHALQGHVNPMKWKGVTSLHEKLNDHQVLKQGKCATNWIVLLTCQVPPRESYDSRCTAWKVQGTSCLQPALMHGMTGCKFNMIVQPQCCTLQFTTRLGHMVLDQYSLT